MIRGHDPGRQVELPADGLRLLGRALPLLDGNLDTGEVVDRTGWDPESRAGAGRLLAALAGAGVLVEADPGELPPEDLERFADVLRHLGFAPGALAAVRRARVALVGVGALAQAVRESLLASGVGEVTAVEPQRGTDVLVPMPTTPRRAFALVVVTQESHDPELLEAVDTLSRDRDQPWLLVRSLSVEEGWVGPLFVPGRTASYLSLEGRVRGNLPHFDEYQAYDLHVRRSGRPAAPIGALRASLAVLAGIATTEALKFLTGHGEPVLAGKFLTVNLMSWETELHHVLRVPQLDEPGAARSAGYPWKEVRDAADALASRRA
ncbi:MAG TPA: hypothetical protein VNJ70_07295 [Thermoanaerobaculia bacterium]|nr:hypothetical protein [Thermoanaerobaculia bacterium]